MLYVPSPDDLNKPLQPRGMGLCSECFEPTRLRFRLPQCSRIDYFKPVLPSGYFLSDMFYVSRLLNTVHTANVWMHSISGHCKLRPRAPQDADVFGLHRRGVACKEHLSIKHQHARAGVVIALTWSDIRLPQRDLLDLHTYLALYNV